MNVAVTGSHGYIGSVLCKMLTEQGYNVYACDNKNILGGDFRYFRSVVNTSFDKEYFVQSLIDNKVTTLFHLAANSLLGPSATDPLEYYWNNTARTANMLHSLAKRGWKGRIVFSSTAAVYGDQSRPVKETNPLLPCNHYGRSKLMCEDILSIAKMYEIDLTVFRYFNVAGAYGDVGQDAGEPHIITRICNAAAGKSDLVVYGGDYPTDDGTCIRDYVHVRDICNAQIHAMVKEVSGTYNLGTLYGTSVMEIIKSFEQKNGVSVPYSIGERREGDPTFLVADPQKFVDTGFVYQYSNIEQIVTSAWEYFNGVRSK
jgi:UDP-glucose 4-epimerase